MKALDQVLHGTAENHILPFFWMHGEEKEVLLREMDAVRECGIGAVCLESRPHPDYAGELWWRDVDIIMEDARAHNMRVWILDDCAFPTGSANGTAANAPDALRRRFLQQRCMDVCGPLAGASVLLHSHETPETIVAVAAQNHATGEMVCLPHENIQDGCLYWDFPEGLWRVYIVSQKMYGNVKQEYLNPLIRESTQLLLDAVYEPHYQHYGADFGGVFAGFFSDEPGFYTEYSYYTKLGDPNLLLPWTPTMAQELAQLSELPPDLFIVSLYADVEGVSSVCRYLYTDHITRLYRDNFVNVLGDWCRARGVEYMGHIIEDNNSHARLGDSAGHYFRSLEGQDFAGLDVVLHQLIPGMEGIGHITSCSYNHADEEFYTYMLAQMGVSQAALEARKKGRTMCEIFGAFGWAEGTKFMKWLTDFMLVRGVNYFVPHAFSPRAFPDPDCPPHFYAHGKNPQFRPFQQLMRYMNRAAHLLSGGHCAADTAILYHAEAEWTTRPCMLSQVPARVLTQAQIPFHFVTVDYLNGTQLTDGAFVVNDRPFRRLLLPYQHTITRSLLQRLEALRETGVDVRFVGGAPERVIGSSGETTYTGDFAVCLPDELPRLYGGLRLADTQDGSILRTLKYEHADGTVWMLTNEHPHRTAAARLFVDGPAVVYDAMTGAVHPFTEELVLGPYESRIVVCGQNLPAAEPVLTPSGWQLLELQWSLSLTENENYPLFRPYADGIALQNFNRPGGLSRFSGILRYESRFEADAGDAVLDLGAVYETAEVWVNGKPAGMRVAPPYRFELKGLLKDGENTLIAEVRNTLGPAQRDGFSHFLVQEPIGLLGPVRLGR